MNRPLLLVVAVALVGGCGAAPVLATDGDVNLVDAAGSGDMSLAKTDGGGGADGGAAADGGIKPMLGPMPLISRGRPAFASHRNSDAPAAFDADYDNAWRSYHDAALGDPSWIALDISMVPTAQRTKVYSVWWNEAGYNYETSDADSYTLPGDYEIQAHANAGGGTPPTSGWVTLVTVKGNTLSSGAHVLALDSYNWVRFVCTAAASNAATQNTDTGLQWDLHDAHLGVDAWKFGGDSITANSMVHRGLGESYNQRVAALTGSGGYFPAFEMAGHGGWSTAIYLTVIDAYLASFPGRFFCLSLGTNDAGVNLAVFNANMSSLIGKVLAAGKVPVLPTIPYTGDPQHLAAIPGLNGEIQKLYASHGSQLVKGPDLYQVLYDGRATMFDAPTDLHPNAAGNTAIRKAWADAMAKAVYP